MESCDKRSSKATPYLAHPENLITVVNRFLNPVYKDQATGLHSVPLFRQWPIAVVSLPMEVSWRYFKGVGLAKCSQARLD